eukprot:5071330-Pyramimonas_sp.AAC.1
MIRKCELAVPLDGLSPPDLVRYRSKILQTAAAATRDVILRGGPGLRSPTALTWGQLGRAIPRQDMQMAETLLRQHTWTSQMIELRDRQGHVGRQV